MNCQELCERVFREVYVPVLESEFPGVLERLSAGVVGGGSDSLGTDDELSRDHDWGVGRCRLCLPEDEAAEKGRAISEALSSAVPEGYLGLPGSVLRPGDIRVTTIDEIYRELCGRTHPPPHCASGPRRTEAPSVWRPTAW